MTVTEHRKCLNESNRFCYVYGSSYQAETEQNLTAILEHFGTGESDHSESLEMTLDYDCVLAMQHRRNVIPLIAVFFLL